MIAPPNFIDGSSSFQPAFRGDTLETYEIEVEEKKERSLLKEMAIFLVAAAVVGYIVVQLIKPGENDGSSDNGGKEPPLNPDLVPAFRIYPLP